MPKRSRYSNGPRSKRFRRRRFRRRRRRVFGRRRRFTRGFKRRFNYRGVKTFKIPNEEIKIINFDVESGNIQPVLVDYDNQPLKQNYQNLTNIVSQYQRLKLNKVVWTMSNFKLTNRLSDNTGNDIEYEDLRSFALWMYHDKWDNGIPTLTEIQEVATKRSMQDGFTGTLFFGKHVIPSSSGLASTELPSSNTLLTDYLETILDKGSLISADGLTHKFYNHKFVFYPQLSVADETGQDISYELSFTFKTMAYWSASKLGITGESPLNTELGNFKHK